MKISLNTSTTKSYKAFLLILLILLIGIVIRQMPIGVVANLLGNQSACRVTCISLQALYGMAVLPLVFRSQTQRMGLVGRRLRSLKDFPGNHNAA